MPHFLSYKLVFYLPYINIINYKFLDTAFDGTIISAIKDSEKKYYLQPHMD